MTTTDEPRESFKEKSRRLRKEAYQRAKAAHKARAETPEGKAAKEKQKAKARELRRTAYEKVKAAKKERMGTKKAADKAAAAELKAAEDAAKQEALREMLTTGSALKPRPALRLIKSED